MLTLLSYANAIGGGFVWDDHALIEEQAAVQTLGPPASYFTHMFWSDSDRVSRGYYRPLVTWSYALEQQVWSGAPWGFHFTNLLAHLIVVTLVFRLARKAGATPVAASVGAAAFGLFPRLTESVAWISGRTDVLATAAALAVLLLSAGEASERRRSGAAGALLLLGLLCKEVAVAAFVGLLVLELARLRQRSLSLVGVVRSLAPSALALAVYAALRLYALAQDVRRLDPGAQVGVPPAQRGSAALAAFGHYLAMLADPLRPRLQIGVLGEHPWPWVLLGGAGLLVLPWAAWRTRHFFSPLGKAALAAGASGLALVLHVVPLGLHTLASDRFLYLPVAMLAVALAPLAGRAGARWPRQAGGLAVLGLLAFAGATHARNRDWRSDLTLWRAAARSSGPDDSYVQQQLAAILMEVHRYDDALVHLRRSVRRESPTAGLKAHNNLALCLSKLGRHAEAVALFEDIVRQQPAYRRGYLNLTMAYARAGRFRDARSTLDRFSLLAPEDPAVKPLKSLLQRAEAFPGSLNTQDAADPVSRTVARARLFQELGAPHEAAQAWDAVTRAPDATREQVLQATAHLAMEGPLDVAEDALRRAQHLQPPAEVLLELQQALQARAEVDVEG